MDLLGAVAPLRSRSIVDVGGGASLLVDRLLERGYKQLTVVDISESALDVARSRLGDRAREVNWVVADATKLSLPQQVDVWHDRAVYHFLTKHEEQESYLSSLRAALRAGGHAIIATFGIRGPERCSGLPVERYDAAKLAGRLGPEFEIVRSVERTHTTPGGGKQELMYGVLERHS